MKIRSVGCPIFIASGWPCKEGHDSLLGNSGFVGNVAFTAFAPLPKRYLQRRLPAVQEAASSPQVALLLWLEARGHQDAVLVFPPGMPLVKFCYGVPVLLSLYRPPMDYS